MPSKVSFLLTIAQQIERMKNWKEPIVLSTAATVLIRADKLYPLDTEVLITHRVRGAKVGNHQFYVGGYAHPNDICMQETAQRELEEELDFNVDPSSLKLFGLFGPSLYHSSLRIKGDSLELEVSDTRAEPNISFVLAIHTLSLKGANSTFNPKDGEIGIVGWKSLFQIIKEYGEKSGEFNYAHSLFALIQHLGGEPFPSAFEPGVYKSQME